MRVVMSGVASRHDVPLDTLDDLQLAVETILVEEPAVGADLALELSVSGGGFLIRLTGLNNLSVKAALVAASPFQPCEGCLLDVRFLLESLVEHYELIEVAGDTFGVLLEKRAS